MKIKFSPVLRRPKNKNDDKIKIKKTNTCARTLVGFLLKNITIENGSARHTSAPQSSLSGGEKCIRRRAATGRR